MEEFKIIEVDPTGIMLNETSFNVVVNNRETMKYSRHMLIHNGKSLGRIYFDYDVDGNVVVGFEKA